MRTSYRPLTLLGTTLWRTTQPTQSVAITRLPRAELSSRFIHQVSRNYQYNRTQAKK